MISELMSTVSQIELVMKSITLKNPHLVLPLTSPARRVQYDIFGCGYLSNQIKPFTVVPQAVMLGDAGTHLCLVHFSTGAYVSVHFFPNLPDVSSPIASPISYPLFAGQRKRARTGNAL